MTTEVRPRKHSHLASHAARTKAVERTRARLPELVYRSMRLEGEAISRSQAEHAMERASARR